MAKPYPIVPASVLDELHDLNCSLMAYQYAVEAILRRAAEDGLPHAIDALVAGLDNMSKPILEGYQSIHSQVQAFREMGVVGVCTLDESDQEKP
jgi:ActR/RegA family two-component response regulator